MVLHRQILFNLAVANIVDAMLMPFLPYHSEIILSTVSIGGKTITNSRFADDNDCLAGEEEELANLVECLDKTSTAYCMETSAKKTKLMTNNTSGINIRDQKEWTEA